jgi:hypothetical protein
MCRVVPKNMLSARFKTVIALACLLLAVSAGGYWLGRDTTPKLESQVQPPQEFGRDQLCTVVSYEPLLPQEIEYGQLVAQDEFVLYLRRAVDDYLSGDFLPCDSTGCTHRGLVNGEHYADTAYDADLGDFSLTGIDSSSLSGKFIVVGTDIAPGGGESVLLLFKDRPDRIFHAWVYDYGNGGYDLRSFNPYEPGPNEPSLADTLTSLINQICDSDFGV